MKQVFEIVTAGLFLVSGVFFCAGNVHNYVEKESCRAVSKCACCKCCEHCKSLKPSPACEGCRKPKQAN